MATQVDTLLPGNPLTKPEEHGHASCESPGDDSMENGTKRTPSAGEGTFRKRGESAPGGLSVKKQSD